jgi:hypothetical protein
VSGGGKKQNKTQLFMAALLSESCIQEAASVGGAGYSGKFVQVD